MCWRSIAWFTQETWCNFTTKTPYYIDESAMNSYVHHGNYTYRNSREGSLWGCCGWPCQKIWRFPIKHYLVTEYLDVWSISGSTDAKGLPVPKPKEMRDAIRSFTLTVHRRLMEVDRWKQYSKNSQESYCVDRFHTFLAQSNDGWIKVVKLTFVFFILGTCFYYCWRLF